MAEPTMALMELLRKHEHDIDSDFLREGVQIMIQMLIELEAEQQIGAGRYERSSEWVLWWMAVFARRATGFASRPNSFGWRMDSSSGPTASTAS